MSFPEIPERILSKKVNHRLYSEGFYGNKLRSWNTLEECLADNPNGNIIPRYNGNGGGTNFPKYGTPILPTQAWALREIWKSAGASVDRCFWNEEAPDAYLTIQGEIMRTEEHLALFWSSEKTTMRKALQNGKQDQGLKAKLMLEHYLSPNSLSDVYALLDRFPDHVIEFSTYSINLGHNKHRNTIIWEVRKY